MKQKKEIRMEDIARELNISIVSVSNALKDRKGVGEELRRKVKEKADELGYRIPQIPEKKQIKIIGILIAERYIKKFPSFYMNIYRQIVQLASKEGYVTSLEIVDMSMEEMKSSRGFFSGIELDGIMFIGEMNIKFIHEVRKKIKVSAIGIDFYNLDEPMDYIVPDNFHGTQYITQQLIDNGYKKITFLGRTYKYGKTMDCYMGYCKALQKNGLKEHRREVLTSQNDIKIRTNIDWSKDTSTAFIVDSSESIEILLKELSESDLKVPEDITIACAGCRCPEELKEKEGIVFTGYKNEEKILAQMSVDLLVERLEEKINAGNIWMAECYYVDENAVQKIKV